MKKNNNTNYKKSKQPRKFDGKKSKKNAITKFSANPRKKETKTLDTRFTAAYASPYVPDQVPCPVLPLGNDTATVQALNLIVQGGGTSNRVGAKIAMKSLKLNLALVANGANTTTFDNVRVMVFYDRTPEGVYTTSDVILQDLQQNNLTNAGSFMSNLNPNFFDRWVMLMDKFMVIPPNQAATNTNVGSTDQKNFVLREYINLRGLETVYGNNNNGQQTASPMTNAYIQTGGLYIVCYGGSVPGNVGFALTGTARLRFDD